MGGISSYRHVLISTSLDGIPEVPVSLRMKSYLSHLGISDAYFETDVNLAECSTAHT